MASVDSRNLKIVAPLKRNETIVKMADLIIAIWECAKLEQARNQKEQASRFRLFF